MTNLISRERVSVSDTDRPPTVGFVIRTPDNNFNLVRLGLAAGVLFSHSFYLGSHNSQIPPFGVILKESLRLDYGIICVDAFFFLSGLFVTQSLYRDKNTINFIIRRFFRIWPGLFACLVVTALLSEAVSHGLTFPRSLLDPNLYLYILNNARFKVTWKIPGVFEWLGERTINGSIHTLPTEIKMYAGLMVIGLVTMHRRVAIGIAAAGVVGIVVSLFDTIAPWTWLPDYGLAPTAMFFAGVLLFTVADKVRIRAWLLLPLLMVAATAPPGFNTAAALAAVAVGILVAGQAPFRWRPRTDLSYGVYIYGWPSQQLVLSQWPDLDPYILFVSATMLSLAFAALSWRLVEGPAIAFGHALVQARGQARRAGGAVAAARRLWGYGPAKVFAAICLCYLSLCAMSLGVSARLARMPVVPLGVAITSFGPTTTPAGMPFNVQPSGGSAIWVKLDKQAPEGTHIVLDGRPLETVLAQTTATATVPAEATAIPGDKPLLLEVLTAEGRAQSAVATLKVTK